MNNPQSAIADPQLKSPRSAGRRIHFIANCVYGNHLAGGDIHFFEMARAAAEAGYEVNFFGGYALKGHIESQKLPATITLTEDAQKTGINAGTIRGQFALFSDYARRYLGTMRKLKSIKPEDAVYATTDYWFDVLPVTRSRARAKLMIWHMQAPTFGQIMRRSRADVDASRVASLHYWASQNYSIRSFRKCPNKRLLYVHPAMRERLVGRGFEEEELHYVSFGVDPEPGSHSGAVSKLYDAVWIGRIHRQKGIDDLLKTLQYLSEKVPSFKALIIGKVKSEMGPVIEQRGLSKFVEFSGFVSEEEKFRLFKASRVYLMPSRFEGSPRVVGEALVCGLPVVAYDVPTYRPIFGEFLSYVPCYNVEHFSQEAEKAILKSRAGEGAVDGVALKRFTEECSWQTARRTFVKAVRDVTQASS